MYVQFTIMVPREKSFETDFKHFVSDSNFKRLDFDYSSSETVLIQRITLSDIFLVAAHSWRSD